MMKRRSFLIAGGLFSAAAVLRFSPLGGFLAAPAQVEAQGKLYRGTLDGNILTSANAGETWQPHTSFGAMFAVRSLKLDHQGAVQARLDFEGRTFELALAADGKTWWTV